MGSCSDHCLYMGYGSESCAVCVCVCVCVCKGQQYDCFYCSLFSIGRHVVWLYKQDLVTQQLTL